MTQNQPIPDPFSDQSREALAELLAEIDQAIPRVGGTTGPIVQDPQTYRIVRALRILSAQIDHLRQGDEDVPTGGGIEGPFIDNNGYPL